MSVLVIALLLMSFSLPVFADEQDIVDIAAGNEDFSILVAALQEAELVDALKAEGPFTVFAPTNAAFEALLASLDIGAEDLLSHPQLADVLLYHVVASQVLSTDLEDGMTAETLNETSLSFDLSDGARVNESNIIAADIEAGNGVVHVIDAVLIPDNFTYQATEENTEIPKTGSVGLTPIMLAGIMALTGAGLIKKRVK